MNGTEGSETVEVWLVISDCFSVDEWVGWKLVRLIA